MRKKVVLSSLFSAFMSLFVQSQFTIPYFIQDGAVLQRNAVMEWNGKAKPLSTIIIKTGWDKSEFVVQSDSLGRWSYPINMGSEGGPFVIQFQNEKKEISVDNIYLGDVWICSGQSNMEWRPNQGLSSGMEIVKSYSDDQLRFFTVPRNACSDEQPTIKSTWQAATPSSNFNFSAAGFFFGKMLRDSLKIPIGIINATWGGTKAEHWMQEETLQNNNDFSNLLSDYKYGVKGEQLHPFSTALWNGMIAPLTSQPITGVCWYQGESNAGDPLLYAKLLPSLISSWRKAWKKDFPFYIVQIAPFDYDIAIYASMTREAQRLTALNDSLSGLVVTTDIGDLKDIHPLNKEAVGERLARVALAKHYNIDLPYSGPMLDSVQKESDKLILTFKFLQFPKDTFLPLNCFRIAGEDGVFREANAYLEDNRVWVSNPAIQEPQYVRFAFESGDLPNFVNEHGLPASPFRTDPFEMNLPPK